jgi:hypothetical protein
LGEERKEITAPGFSANAVPGGIDLATETASTSMRFAPQAEPIVIRIGRSWRDLGEHDELHDERVVSQSKNYSNRHVIPAWIAGIQSTWTWVLSCIPDPGNLCGGDESLRFNMSSSTFFNQTASRFVACARCRTSVGSPKSPLSRAGATSRSAASGAVVSARR